ncbi:hypothetical protein ACFFU8_09290 [Chromobacterium piscinae]|uniref:hypothetical protein n=1 Tax=Chromobacterium piscinae TaxID=686831 RepID=UPI001E43DD4C|nr:hypothetical protein [Chromobacterium piscinae]MCD5327902.1 hypothetical protein [Chromobacterium piscinae]
MYDMFTKYSSSDDGMGKPVGYLGRNRPWIVPLCGASIFLASLVLLAMLGIVVPAWVFLAGVIVSLIALYLGLFRVDTFSAVLLKCGITGIGLAKLFLIVIGKL